MGRVTKRVGTVSTNDCHLPCRCRISGTAVHIMFADTQLVGQCRLVMGIVCFVSVPVNSWPDVVYYWQLYCSAYNDKKNHAIKKRLYVVMQFFLYVYFNFLFKLNIYLARHLWLLVWWWPVVFLLLSQLDPVFMVDLILMTYLQATSAARLCSLTLPTLSSAITLTLVLQPWYLLPSLHHWLHGYKVGFVVRGESPGCRLISTASMLEWLRNLLPHHSQGSSTERWSRNGHCQSVLRPMGGFNVPPLF